MSFSTPYPYAFIISWLLLAAGISYFLYRNNPLNIANIWLRKALYLLRFSVVFSILLLLLGPLFELKTQRIEKPIIALLVDNTASLLSGGKNKEELKNQLANLLTIPEKLGEDYQVKIYSFGESLKENTNFDFNEKQSNIAAGIKGVGEAHYNLNLASIILVSDGIYNAGENPMYEAIQQKTKVYPVALGDSTRKKDVWIKQVKHNDIVFEGNNFTVEVAIAANFVKGNKVFYNLSENANLINAGSLLIQTDPGTERITLTLPANKEGLHSYKVKLQPIAGESNLINNTFSFEVEVLKSKQKLVIVAQNPHPDVSALVQTLKTNPNYEVFSYLMQNYKEEYINEASLFILHQLPGNNGTGEALIKNLQAKNKPIFYILGKQNSSYALGKLGILSINGPPQNFNESQAWINNDFPLFLVDEELSEFVQKAPPLITLYGSYKTPLDATILLNQQIGYVKTNQALLFFSQSKGSKYAVLAGEGFWKWRLHDFLLNQNQVITQQLLGKIIQWTAGNNDQSRFRFNPVKKKFDETEAALFEAEVYNETFELTQQKDVEVKISNSNGQNYQYTLAKNGKGYELNAGKLSPGIYSYVATVKDDKSFPVKKGNFSVQALQLELLQTKAEHGLLEAIAAETGGKMYYPNKVEDLVKELKENAQIKPIIYEEQDIELLINFKLLLALLLLGMSLEWLIRKWNGFI